jgi:hypothetical protein
VLFSNIQNNKLIDPPTPRCPRSRWFDPTLTHLSCFKLVSARVQQHFHSVHHCNTRPSKHHFSTTTWPNLLMPCLNQGCIFHIGEAASCQICGDGDPFCNVRDGLVASQVEPCSVHQRCRHTDYVSSHNRPQHSTHQPLYTRLILARRSTPEAMILWSMQAAYGVGNVRAMPDAVSLTFAGACAFAGAYAFAGACVCVLCFRVHADSCLHSVKFHALM